MIDLIDLSPPSLAGNNAIRVTLEDFWASRTPHRAMRLTDAVYSPGTRPFGLLMFDAWWLHTLTGERLRSALAWSTKTLPPIAIMDAAITAGRRHDRVTPDHDRWHAFIGAYYWCFARRRAAASEA
jgi:hypothetical protein